MLIRCGFCNKSEKEVSKLIHGTADNYICENCVKQCQKILEADNKDNANKLNVSTFNNAKEIKEMLDKYVVGQEEAKKKIAVAIYKHYSSKSFVSKNNVLLIGPSGVGKTELARAIAKIKGVPFAIADATSLTQAGYVGEDVESILLKLLIAADYDVEKAENGIIYIDEIDKIGRKGESVSLTRDVSGEGVQQALLKIIEGTVANVQLDGRRKHPQGNFTQIDTSNILFICGGAFEGIDKIIQERMEQKNTIGFNIEMEKIENKEDLIENVTVEDLIKFGMIPEFIGRLPVVATLKELTKEELIQIMKLNLEKEYNQFDISFDDKSLQEIAQKAIERKSGARGLRAILEELTFEYIYNGIKKHIDKQDVLEKLG